MRLLVLQAVAAGLFVGAAGGGQGQDEARAIVEKAIKAQGGEEYLKKYQAGAIKAKGRIEIGGGLDFEQEISIQMPDKFRDEVTLTINGNPVRTVAVFDGKKGAIEVMGKKLPSDEKLQRMLRDAGQTIAAMQLLPLRGKDYEVSVVGEAQVNGKPAIGIRAAKKDQPDVTLYFDKETHYLVKAESRTIDFMSGQEVAQERIMTDYQKVDGRPVPKHVLINRDGKKFIEAEVLEMKDVEKFDDRMFTLP